MRAQWLERKDGRTEQRNTKDIKRHKKLAGGIPLLVTPASFGNQSATGFQEFSRKNNKTRLPSSASTRVS